MLHFYISHRIVTRPSRVSRAPPHNTRPAFLTFNGTKYKIIKDSIKNKFDK